MRSICCDSYENGGSSFLYYKHLFGVQLSALASRTAGTTSFQSYRFNRFLSG